MAYLLFFVGKLPDTDHSYSGSPFEFMDSPWEPNTTGCWTGFLME